MNRNEAEAALYRIQRDMNTARRRQEKLSRRLVQLEADAVAIRRSWAILGDGAPLDQTGVEVKVTIVDQPPQTFADAQKAAEKRGELIRSVRQVVKNFTPDFDFTTDHIRRILSKHYPDVERQTQKSSIAVTLRQMERNKEITITHKGRGRAFSKYRRNTSPTEARTQ